LSSLNPFVATCVRRKACAVKNNVLPSKAETRHACPSVALAKAGLVSTNSCDLRRADRRSPAAVRSAIEFIFFPRGRIVQNIIRNALVFLGIANDVIVETRLPTTQQPCFSGLLRYGGFVSADNR
jgi:hypothetical protein